MFTLLYKKASDIAEYIGLSSVCTRALLFALEAGLLKKNEKINIRPIKGLVKMAISNYILKSRYGYNDDYICKYVPKETVSSS